MASNLHINKPYVLKALSRPLDRPDGPGRHTVGEVFGQKQGSKKRKRAELSVAIDGDAVHLYDIPSSQAITSYLVSPQSFFTCAPYSLRCRSSSTKDVIRYTYVSFKDSLSSKREVKLFKDVLTEKGSTTSTAVSYTLRSDKSIVHLSAVSSKHHSSAPLDEGTPEFDLVAVMGDGALLCLHGETLEKRWETSPSVLLQDVSSGSKSELHVDFVQPALAADVIDGMFGGKHELFGVFQEKVHPEGFNPDILVVATSQQPSPESQQRHLHILALPHERDLRQATTQKAVPIFAAPFPCNPDGVLRANAKYQLDIRSGTLQELCAETIYTYDLKGGIPRLQGKLQAHGVTSFLRLSKSSVLTSTSTSLSLFNPVYRSLQATIPMSLGDLSQHPSASDAAAESCQLVTYLSSREIAVGLGGTALIAIQLEAPKNRNTKRRAEGLLTDAIRHGIPVEQGCEKRGRADHAPSAIVSDYLPGSMVGIYWADWQRDIAKADDLLRAQDLRAFETLLAGKLNIPVKDRQPIPDGIHTDKDGAEANGSTVAANLPEWLWPSSRAEYPHVDRRWVFYSIRSLFAWDSSSSNSDGLRLTCRYPESNVLNYLVDAGHLSTSNIKSAFKDELRDVDEIDSILGEGLPPLLGQIDPTMDLLLAYLSATQLGPVELVSAIKAILRSLDLVEDPAKTREHGTRGDNEQEQDGDNDTIGMELDRAEEELQITEYYLGNDSGARARGLSVAFSRLAMCPAPATVQSLRRLFKPDETLCLINVLRMELIKDGWTTRYLDMPQAEGDEYEAPPDGSIRLIADLLCRCIDSVGLGGWLVHDTMLANWGSQQDSVDFFQQFLAEVSVALEGVEEVVRLQGTLAEAFKYVANSHYSAMDSGKSKAASIHSAGPLPFGLSSSSKLLSERAGAGLEAVPHSSRQSRHFAGKKMGSYSVARISEERLVQEG
ncbi:hypothetical protein QBC46DRAFT_280223 [Diplogelasinospora grovesii]|uniref:Uncharacterized protein n=1 Tax=Diplogelasinospora grovesii TaxID=303347 RepID=A0AAN6NFV5_9PEZI|nr:hypothetical protein QBC46DRAFT_280223 [Diplogelasinospora grovesii]